MEVKFLKKKYQEKWENAYLTVKGSPAFGALSRPQTPSLKVMYLQTKPNEDPRIFHIKKSKITFTKMIRIFHVEIDIC